MQCNVDVCQQRDSKGIYARAKTGQTRTVLGVGADYEPSLAAETAVDTTTLFPPEAARFIIAQLQTQDIIGENKHETNNSGQTVSIL